MFFKNMFRRISARKILQSNYTTEAAIKNTVDEKEIVHFEKLVHEWWDSNGPLRPLHAMNKLRVPFIRDGLINCGLVKNIYVDTPTPLQNLQILDVGCGGGILSEPLSRLGCKVTGIDASSELIDVAKKHSLNKNLDLTYLNANLEEHCKKYNEKYDAVIASEVLEHVTHKDTFIESLVKCLKPGGCVFITTINKTYLAYFTAIVLGEQVLSLLPKGTHEFDKFIAPYQVQRHLEDQNCKTQLIHGIYYNVLTNKWNWISDCSVNYALRAIKV